MCVDLQLDKITLEDRTGPSGCRGAVGPPGRRGPRAVGLLLVKPGQFVDAMMLASSSIEWL